LGFFFFSSVAGACLSQHLAGRHLAQCDLNLGGAGCRFRRDPRLVAREQDEQAPLGAGRRSSLDDRSCVMLLAPQTSETIE
jgi:hypothetical protein